MQKLRINRNGSRFWYLDGKKHRIGGAAKEFSDGIKWWCKEGEVHRLKGPVVEGNNGIKYWYIEGELYKTKEEYDAKIKNK